MSLPGPEAEGPLAIAFVIARWPPALGGTEAQAAALAAQLSSRGHRVEVLTQRLPGPPARGYPGVHRLAPRVGGRAASGIFGLRLLAALLRLRPQIVQAFLLSSPALFAVIAGRISGRPVVVKTGASGPDGDLSVARRGVVSRVTARLILRLADALVAPSAAARDELQAAGVPAGRCTVIPNGVDPARFAPPRGEDGNRDRTVLFAGRLEAQKDPLTLLEGWLLAVARRPGARLVIAGEGAMRPLLEETARSLASPGSVSFAGPVSPEEMPAFWRRGSVVVLPSRSEGLSNALLEAMASGLAPVLSDIPGNREIFPEGEGALFFPPGDASALADLLGRLLDDDELRIRLGRKAVDRAAAFSVERTATMYLDLHRSLLARRGAA